MIKRHKNKIIAGIIIIIVLAFAFLFGPNAPSNENSDRNVSVKVTHRPKSDKKIKADKNKTADETQQPVRNDDKAETENTRPQKADGTPMTASEKIAYAEKMAEQNNVSYEYETDDSVSSPKDKPAPSDSQMQVSNNELTCTLSVRCDTVLNNIAWLDKEKVDIIPKNGIIFPETKVVFYDGESVFNVLQREMKRNKIHMEFENTPIYKSAYIEGIANLYEYDCGELSGWMYKVNGWFPNYGSSRYRLKDGDKIEWVYTCDLGADVGDNTAGKNGLNERS